VNEFEQYESKKARRLAYRIVFKVLFSLLGGVWAYLDFTHGRVGWGTFWVFFTLFALLLDFYAIRAQLRAFASIHDRDALG
jgi:hypothetical protein